MPVRLCPGHRRRRNDLDEQQLRLLLCGPLRVQLLPTASNQHEDQLNEHLLTNKQPSHGPWMASQLVGCDSRFEVIVENGFIFSHQLVVKSPLAALVLCKRRALARTDTSATTAAAARPHCHHHVHCHRQHFCHRHHQYHHHHHHHQNSLQEACLPSIPWPSL